MARHILWLNIFFGAIIFGWQYKAEKKTFT